MDEQLTKNGISCYKDCRRNQFCCLWQNGIKYFIGTPILTILKLLGQRFFFWLLQYQMIIMQTNHLTLLHTFTYFYTCRIGLISKTEKFKVNTNYCCMLKQKLRLHEGVNKRETHQVSSANCLNYSSHFVYIHWVE